MNLLLLPGYACTAEIWLPLLRCLPACWQADCANWPPDRLAGFARVEDYSGWLETEFSLELYDAIIGHSMGGLAALHLAARRPARVLVETFLTPPAPFFQMLTCTGCDAKIEQQVRAMLAEQGPQTHPELRAALRQVDFRAGWPGRTRPALAIYGDRGVGETPTREALHWPAAWEQTLVKIVAHSGHFPMLENPGDLAQALETGW